MHRFSCLALLIVLTLLLAGCAVSNVSQLPPQRHTEDLLEKIRDEGGDPGCDQSLKAVYSQIREQGWTPLGSAVVLLSNDTPTTVVIWYEPETDLTVIGLPKTLKELGIEIGDKELISSSSSDTDQIPIRSGVFDDKARFDQALKVLKLLGVIKCVQTKTLASAGASFL